MRTKDNFLTALRGLSSNRSRSMLTVLGIVIGIAAIIMVMSIGGGAQELILDQVRGMGSRTISVEPGKEPTGPSSFAEIFTDTLKERDVEALRNPGNVRGIKELTPEVIQVAPITYENETIRSTVLGSSELVSTIFDIYAAEGAFFTDEDIRQAQSVAVIGSEVKSELFGLSDAVGEKIKIKGRSYAVTGVLAPEGQVSIFNFDDMVIIPYSTAQDYLMGIDYYNAILVMAETEDAVPQVVRDIEATLREMHGIDDPEKDDFHVMSQADAAERVKTITGILTLLLISVAAISLVVGGIGIMNIMLVSVTERTREIGLRKALGATNKNILNQFLTEAVLLTAAGGVLGIFFGGAASLLVSIVLTQVLGLKWTFVFPISAALLGLFVAASIGLIFGLYPARKAAQKSPIEALRYE